MPQGKTFIEQENNYAWNNMVSNACLRVIQKYPSKYKMQTNAKPGKKFYKSSWVSKNQN